MHGCGPVRSVLMSRSDILDVSSGVARCSVGACRDEAYSTYAQVWPDVVFVTLAFRHTRSMIRCGPMRYLRFTRTETLDVCSAVARIGFCGCSGQKNRSMIRCDPMRYLCFMWPDIFEVCSGVTRCGLGGCRDQTYLTYAQMWPNILNV